MNSTLPICPCSSHPFGFASRKLVTKPVSDPEVWARIAALKEGEHQITLCVDGKHGRGKASLGAIIWRDNVAWYKYDNAYLPVTPDNTSYQCVYAPTIGHSYAYAVPDNTKRAFLICTRAHRPVVRGAYRNYFVLHPVLRNMLHFPRVRIAYAKYHAHALDLGNNKNIPAGIVTSLTNHAESQFYEHAEMTFEEFLPLSNIASKLIRRCAWEIQKLIMLGMICGDFAQVPKDVCKIIHRMVFDGNPIMYCT
jgi:hypothetical protein